MLPDRPARFWRVVRCAEDPAGFMRVAGFGRRRSAHEDAGRGPVLAHCPQAVQREGAGVAIHPLVVIDFGQAAGVVKACPATDWATPARSR